MKRKNIMLALALLGTSLTGGSVMAQDGTLACTSCGVAAPVKMAQVQMQQAPGRAAAVRGNGDVRPLETCCDPKLATISWGTFPDDLDTTNPNFINKYGLKYTPTAAFHSAMNNSGEIAHIMVSSLYGAAWSWVVMEGEVRTNGVAAQSPALSPTAAPNDASNFFTTDPLGAYSSLAGTVVRINPTGSASWMAGWQGNLLPGQFPSTGSHSTAFTLANAATWSAPGNPHMAANGTIYAIKPTFWIYYYVPGQGLKKRQLLCNGLKEKFVGFQKGGTSDFKLSGPQSGLVGAVDKAPNLDARSMQLGAEVAASAEEVKAIDKLNQGSNLKK